GGDAAPRVRPPARPARRTLGLPRRARRRGPTRRPGRGGDRGDRDRQAPGRSDTARGVTEPYILIAEDDAELRHLLGRGLREEGFRIEAVSTGAELLERAGQSPPDVLVVDIGLPDADGRDVCQ